MDFLFDIVFGFLISRLIAVRPVIRFVNNQMEIRSDWRTWLWTLGAWHRRITIDRQLEEVRIRQRIFWFFTKRRRLEFNWMQEVLYGYADSNPFSFWAHQSYDVYTISLKLKNGEQVKLCRYFGEGGYVLNGPLPDWYYYGDALMAQVTRVDQDDASLSLADMLSKILNVSIGNPLP